MTALSLMLTRIGSSREPLLPGACCVQHLLQQRAAYGCYDYVSTVCGQCQLPAPVQFKVSSGLWLCYQHSNACFLCCVAVSWSSGYALLLPGKDSAALYEGWQHLLQQLTCAPQSVALSICVATLPRAIVVVLVKRAHLLLPDVVFSAC
jgi:hypothetical protein